MWVELPIEEIKQMTTMLNIITAECILKRYGDYNNSNNEYIYK
jgi:hypothetical protein